MKCIVVDDEPLAREGVELLIKKDPRLALTGSFNNVGTASEFMRKNEVDLIFLDIQMPGITGIEFAKMMQEQTLIIFITAYSEYALDSYDVDAIDYLLKPVSQVRFQKAVEKALSYHKLLLTEISNISNSIEEDYIFVRSDRKNVKIFFKDIKFIEGLKDYVVIHTNDKKVITLISIKNMLQQLPEHFIRINKSYIVNTWHIDSFNNNDIFIGEYEIAIGSNFRDLFFEKFVGKKTLRQ